MGFVGKEFDLLEILKNISNVQNDDISLPCQEHKLDLNWELYIDLKTPYRIKTKSSAKFI